MEKDYKLRQSDYEQIEAVIKITSSIDILYRRLYDLEINNQKDTDEYKKILEYLDISLEVEKGNYEKMNLSANKCVLIINYLLEQRMSSDPKSDLETIILQEDFNRVIRRVISILGSKVLNDHSELQRMIPSQLIEMLQYLGLQNANELVMESIQSSVIMRQAFEKETLNTFLLFLQEVLEDKNYLSFRNRLLKAKYDIIFVNKDIESEMLISNFNVMNFLFNSKITADFLSLDSNLYKILKNGYGVKISTYQIAELLELSDMDYSSQNTALASILRQLYMRSGFLLLDDEVISDVNYEFHEFVENPNYLNKHKEDKISISVIIQAFRKIKKDREKYGSLSSSDERRIN